MGTHSPNHDTWYVTVKSDGIVQVSTMCTCGNDSCSWHASVSWSKDDEADKAVMGAGRGLILNNRD